MSQNAYTEPFAVAGIATAEAGSVVLDGPDGVAVTMTAEAAMRTGHSLVKAAEQALLQNAPSLEK